MTVSFRIVVSRGDNPIARSTLAQGMKRQATVYWLMPAKDERELFCDIVHILCRQLDAPNFDPHLTIFVGSDGKAANEILRAIKSRPITLKAVGVGYSSKFTKTLFVRFEANGPLKKLVRQIAVAAKSRPRELREPHVSLLYKKVPVSVKRELASTIRLPFRRVTFDSICATQCALPTANRRDVASWRSFAKKRLSR